MTTRSARAVRAAGLLALLLSISQVRAAGNLAELPKRAAEFKLANGMRVVVLERHAAPLVSFHLRAGAGAADEPEGKSGICLMLERMFQHGSEAYGSRNSAQEKAVLQTVEKFMDTVSVEMARGDKANPLLSQDSEIQARIAIANAAALGHRSFHRDVLEAHGAVGARVSAGAVSVDLTATLPAHRAEAWPRMVGEWLRRPSWRFFYDERNALSAFLGEQSQRPQVRIQTELLNAAFPNRPYSRMTPSAADAMRLRPRDLEAFMSTRWSPANLVLAIVGDVTVAEARRLAETYFGPLAARPPMSSPAAAEPLVLKQEKRVRVEAQSAAVLGVSWYRPNSSDPDDSVFDVLAAMLEGRKGPLFERLKDVVLATRVNTALPSHRDQSLFQIELFLPPTQTFAAVDKQLLELIEQLASAPVSESDLEAAKRSLRSRVVASAEDHAGAANLLARATGESGSVAAFDAALDRIATVTSADVQRVAKRYLGANSRFVLHAGLPGVVELEAE